jgi:hypothetical protein
MFGGQMTGAAVWTTSFMAARSDAKFRDSV